MKGRHVIRTRSSRWVRMAGLLLELRRLVVAEPMVVLVAVCAAIYLVLRGLS